MMYITKIEEVDKKISRLGENTDYLKLKLIEFIKELINTGEVNNLFNVIEISKIENWLSKASLIIHTESELESLIDSRCEVWESHYGFEGSKKDFLRVIVYTMYSYKLEDLESYLDELIANIILDLAKVNTKFADKFIEKILNEN